MTKEQAPETIAATYGVATDAAFGAVAPPIYGSIPAKVPNAT